jgi:hypothetical protein
VPQERPLVAAHDAAYFRTPSRDRRIGTLILRLNSAYVAGHDDTGDDQTEAARQVWWKSLQGYTKSRLSPVEQRITAICKQYCKAAITATLQLHISEACRLFGVARGYSQQKELSAEAALLCQSELAAAESDLDFSCRDFEQAKFRLLLAMALDEELERRYGYKLLHVHRIHLLAKMIKVESIISGVPFAMDLAARGLIYLESARNELPIPGWWTEECLSAIPASALQFLTRQITVELAAALADEPCETVGKSLSTIVNRTDFRKKRAHWDDLSHAWCELKLLAAQKPKSRQYLESCAIFFAGGRKKADALWYLAALDAARACHSFQLAPARDFCNRVAADLMSAKLFPLSLRGKWCKLLAER